MRNTFSPGMAGRDPVGRSFLVFKLEPGWVAHPLGFLSPLAWLLPGGGLPGCYAARHFLITTQLAALPGALPGFGCGVVAV